MILCKRCGIRLARFDFMCEYCYERENEVYAIDERDYFVLVNDGGEKGAEAV